MRVLESQGRSEETVSGSKGRTAGEVVMTILTYVGR